MDKQAQSTDTATAPTNEDDTDIDDLVRQTRTVLDAYRAARSAARRQIVVLQSQLALARFELHELTEESRRLTKPPSVEAV